MTAFADAVPASSAPTLERCRTGIEGLDNILSGGIPRGNAVLVAGNVGTGKTTLSLEFLVRGAEAGEKGLFLSVTEASARLIQNLSTFEFFRPELVQTRQLVFVDMPLLYQKLGLHPDELTSDDIDVLVRNLAGLAKEVGAKRVVVDSLTSVLYRIQLPERVREFVLKLSRALHALGSTTLFVSELGGTTGPLAGHGVEEAIVDGVILLGNTRRQGDILRVLQVVKMRGTAHSRAQYVIELSPIGLLMAPHLKGGRSEVA